jgi:hypothetical protein
MFLTQLALGVEITGHRPRLYDALNQRGQPYVDAYLVASEIETSKYSGILIPERTKSLADRIHEWNVESQQQ